MSRSRKEICEKRAEAWCRFWQDLGFADDSYYEDCYYKEYTSCMVAADA